MADPLSIASGVAGLITLAEQVFFGICRYIKAVRGAKEEVFSLSNGLRNLHSVLSQLRLWAAQKEVEDTQQGLPRSTRLPLVDACHRLLLKLSHKLEKLDPNKTPESLLRQLKWPFSSSEMRQLVEDLEHLKSSITLALSSDTMVAIVQILSEQYKIADDIRDIKEGLEKQRQFEERFNSMISKKERKEVVKYFEKISPAKRHQTSKALRHPNTGMWLVETEEFQDWLAGKCSLWLSGIPGAGKTVLASAAIEAAEEHCRGSNMAYAYFYCDYKDEPTQDLINILGSLLAQLAVQSVEAFNLVQECYQSHESDTVLSRSLEAKTLVELFDAVSACFEVTLVIVDGLDECGSRAPRISRELSDIAAIPESGTRRVAVAILSRAEEDIKSSLGIHFNPIEIAARSGDVQLFVSQELDRRMRIGELEISSHELKDIILKRLIEGAAGMFRWVACQLDYLCELPTDKDRRNALNTLPPNLEETYIRILRRVHAQKAPIPEIVRKTLRWIICAREPMAMEALREALCVQNDVNFLNSENKPSSRVILRHCSSLIRVSIDGKHLELAHFTVEEFLCMEKPPASNESEGNNELGQYFVNRSMTDLELARVSLVYLNLKDFDIPSSKTVEDKVAFVAGHAFRTYAVVRWPEHAREHFDDCETFELMKQLFRPSKSRNFNLWAQDLILLATAHLLERPHDKFTELSAFGTSYGATPLHFASLIRAAPLVQWLLSQGLDANQSSRLGCPIHCSILEAQSMLGCIIPLEDIDYEKQLNVNRHTLATVTALVNAGADCNVLYVDGGRKSHSIFPWLTYLHGEEENIRHLFRILLKPGIKVGQKFLDEIQDILLDLESRNIDEYDWTLGSVRAFLDFIRAENLEESLRPGFLRLAALAGSSAPLSWIQNSNDLDQFEIEFSVSQVKLAAFETAIRFDNEEEVKIFLLKDKLILDTELPGEALPALHVAAKYGSVSSTIILTQAGARVNQEDSNGQTALHHCSSNNFPGVARLLLNNGAKIEQHDRNGRTALHVAAAENSAAVLKLLMEHNSYEKHFLWLKSNFGKAPLQEAAENNAEATLVLIVKDIDDLTPHSHNSEFHLAEHIVSLQYETVEMFLTKKMDLTIPDQCRSHLLNVYLKDPTEQLLPQIHLLLKYGVSIDDVDSRGRTPLHNLLNGLYWPVMDLEDLVPELATTLAIEAKDSDGYTALHYFLRHGDTSEKSVPILRALLEHGANLETIGPGGITCLDLLLESDSAEITNEPSNEDRSRLGKTARLLAFILTEAKDFKSLSKNSSVHRNLLVWAAMAEQDQLLHQILDQTDLITFQALELLVCARVATATIKKILSKAKPAVILERSATSNSTLLHVMCSDRAYTDIHVLEILLAVGCDVNALRLPNNVTALMLAAQQGKLEFAKVLLHHRADLGMADKMGWTAIHFAVGSHSIEMLELFASHQQHQLDWSNFPAFDFFMIRPNFEVKEGTLIHLATQNPRSLEKVLRKLPNADIDVADARGITPVHVAAGRGNLEVLKLLQTRGANFQLCSLGGISALHYAASGGSVETVQFLIDVGADINKATSDGRLAVHVAAAFGCMDVVCLLLDAGSKLPIDKNGQTPESVALLNSHFLIAHVIGQAMASGVSTIVSKSRALQSSVTPYAMRVLERAITGNDSELVEKLLSATPAFVALPSACNGCGPLFAALVTSQVETVDVLLRKGLQFTGVGCSRTNRVGWSPLALAAKDPTMLKVLELMLSKEIPGEYHIGYRFHPLYAAVSTSNTAALGRLLRHYGDMASGHPITSRYGANAPLLRPLLDNDMLSIPWTSCPGSTLLHATISTGDEEIVQMLVDHGANVDAQNAELRTPLHHAAYYNQLSIAKLLVKHGANPESRTFMHQTPAMMAAQYGHFQIARELDPHGCHLSYCDIYGMSCLQYHLGSSFTHAYVFKNKDNLPYQGFPFRNAWGHTKASICANERKHILRFTKALESSYIDRPHMIGSCLPDTPMALAALQGHIDLIELLLQKGWSINAEFKSDKPHENLENPLIAACLGGRLKVLRFLIRYIGMKDIAYDRTLPGILEASRHFPEFRKWILKEHCMEQPRLCNSADHPEAKLWLWSGLEKKSIPLGGKFGRKCHESMLDYAIRVKGMREFLQGKSLRWSTLTPYPFVMP